MKVGILGGAGAFGSGIGARLAGAGWDVVLGAREPDRAEEVARSLGLQRLTGGSLESAAGAEIVIVSLPAEAIAEVATELRSRLAGKTVVCPVNNLSFRDGELSAEVSSGNSSSEVLQAALPESFVATALNHVPARVAGALDAKLNADVLICASSERALDDARQLVNAIDGLRPVHAGSLAMSSIVEALTAVIINVNKRERRHASLCLSEQG